MLRHNNFQGCRIRPLCHTAVSILGQEGTWTLTSGFADPHTTFMLLGLFALSFLLDPVEVESTTPCLQSMCSTTLVATGPFRPVRMNSHFYLERVTSLPLDDGRPFTKSFNTFDIHVNTVEIVSYRRFVWRWVGLEPTSTHHVWATESFLHLVKDSNL